MIRNKKILVGVSVIALGALSALAVGASAHDRNGGGYGKHHGGPGMKRHMHAERLFDRFDLDKDGKVTVAEIDTARADSLARFDANGDGVLQLEEYQGLWMERMRSRMVDGFQRLDDDGDGKVTGDEMKAPMTRIARFMDRDSDGAITRDELHRRHKGERRHHRDDEKDRRDSN
ncbi:MAG: hypothetical protein WD767_18170 [Alphaproteobacteria bacterium]